MTATPGAATQPHTPPLVAVRGLGVRYPDTGRPALEDVAFEVHAGELVGIVGLNGSGKSTLCRCLNGIVPQLLAAEVTGTVTVAGRDATHTPVRHMATVVGMVLDQPGAQVSQATAEEEVALGLEALGVPYADMVVRVGQALRAVGLEHAAGRSPHSLSGGEQQRLLLAAVMAMRPSVLVLDEPTSGLDPRGKADVFDLLLRQCRDAGTAVLIAEHDVETLAEWADRILVLDQGRLVEDGPAAAVLGSVATMRSAGLPVPQVAEVALALGGIDGALPVTVDRALDWLATAR